MTFLEMNLLDEYFIDVFTLLFAVQNKHLLFHNLDLRM